MTASNSDDPDLVEELIRTAGRRLDPPAAAYERTLAAATAALRAKRRRLRMRLLVPAALAATAAVAAVLLYGPPGDGPRLQVATVDRLAGSSRIRETRRAPWTPVAGEAIVRAGSTVRTDATGRLGLRLANGTSLRLAEASEILIEDATRIVLLSGRIYADTGMQAPEGRRLEVVTDAGTAVDRGTQFEVLYDDDTYRLRVREGRVVVLSAGQAADAGAGQEISLDPADPARLMRRADVAPDDPDWQWVESVAPAPDIEGMPLTTLLAWVSRETGRPVRYASAALEQAAQRVILHGKVRDLAPMEVLAAMLATTDLRFRLADDGTILIESKAGL
jgi:ferric-dicitrate binding protein FerR (iron transport regulator)